MAEVLDDYIRILEDAIARTEPMSQRARVLTTLLRFAQRGDRTLTLIEEKQPGFSLIAQILEVRDMARKEQAWIDELLHNEVFAPEHEAVLARHKMMLAVVESTHMTAIGYVGSEKERSPEGEWWSRRAGEVLAETLATVPSLMALPEDRKV